MMNADNVVNAARARVWTEAPIRRRLAFWVAAQSLTLLAVAFLVLFYLGRQWEREEVRAELRARAGFLTALLEPAIDAGPGPAGDLLGAQKSELIQRLRSVLQRDRRVRNLRLYLADSSPPGFELWALIGRGEGSDAAARAQLNPRLAQLAQTLEVPVLDEDRHGPSGEAFIAAYAPIRSADGRVRMLAVMDMPVEDLRRYMDYFTPVIGVMFVLAALLSILLASMLSRLFTRPVERLLAATERLADGEYDVSVTAQSKDEIGRLSEAFNRMAAAVRAHQSDWRASNRQLDLLNRQLRDTMVELEQVNSDLAQSRNFLSTLIEHTPTPIIVTDPDERILMFNASAQALFGWAADEIIGDTMARIYSRENRPEVRADLDRRIRRGREWSGEFLGRTKGGDDRLLEVTVTPVRDDHETVLACMYLAQDVTETRQLQDLSMRMERMSTRGEMAAEIAHEINNYLTILGCNLDVIPMLLAAGHHDKLERKFRAMREVLEKIARFSDGLMGYTDTRPRRVDCHLNRVIESLVGFLKPQNRYDGIHIQLDLDTDLPAVPADIGQIQQVLVNLLNNAADSIRSADRPDGRIVVSTRGPGQDACVRCCIEDNGTGIPAEAMARLFRERFTSKQGGHGFGLLTSRKIMEVHGGCLEVESREGQGAAFTIRLPLASAAPADPRPATRSSAGA